MNNERIYLNALNAIEGIGSQKIRLLLDFFGSAEAIWKAEAKELASTQISQQLIEKIIQAKKEINPEEEMKKLEKEKIKILLFGDENYPHLLKEIPNPPYLLYLKSEDKSFDFNLAPMIVIVGSRKFTPYGKQVAQKIASELAKAGIIIVSGLAIGIDSFAHRAAIEAGGKTIAVLGSSLEDKMIGPRSNFELSRRILENGALISDYPLGTPSAPGNFPARNRLMAGLALGTIVIEATLESGTLITANLALEFNREVFAVPGSIFSPQSEGAHKLIKAGAKIATNINDILEELNIPQKMTAKKIKKIIPTTIEEEKILKTLSAEPLHIDTISKLTKLEASVASATLAIMEMKGIVKNVGGQNYISL